MANAEQLITGALERELTKPLAEDVKETHFALRQGYEGMMLDKIQKQNAAVLDLAKRTREGTVGQPSPQEPEEMGVNIGQRTFIVHAAPEKPESAPAAKGMSTLTKVGVGAALAAAGVGLPAAGFAVSELLDDDKPAAVAPVEPGPDRDTYLPYEFGIE